MQRVFGTPVPFVGVLLHVTLALAQPGPSPPPTPAPRPTPPAPPAANLVPPRLISDAVVDYPPGAKGDADVLLTLTIGPDGRVLSSHALEPQEPFSSVAETQSLTWIFAPGTRNGKPVTGVIQFQVKFVEPPPPPEDGPGHPSSPASGSSPSEREGAPTASDPAPQATARATPLQEVLIVGERAEPGRSASLSRAEVREIPGAFGDPFRAIEILPGVTPLVSGLPYFYVRGAPPGNVGYFLDGVRVPLLYHIGLGPSVIHPGLIERVDLYPGGYPASFGRFAGGIVSGETNAPRQDVHGEGNIRLFDAGAMVEAPLPVGHGSILLGGRYSYTAALLSIAAPGLALSYWDYQGRISLDLTPKDRITAFFFGSYDYLGQDESGVTKTLFGTEFHRLDLRYDHALEGGGTNRLAVTLGVDLSRLDEGRFVRDRTIAVRQQIAYPLSPDVLVRGGVNATLDVYDVQLTGDSGEESKLASLFPSRSDLSLGAHLDAVIKVTPDLEIVPGIRADFYGSQGATAAAIDPRLAWRLTMSPRLHLLAAFGVAHQPPAFAIPVPGFQPGGLQGGLQTALQQSAGVEAELPSSITATMTVFHNGFLNMSDPFSSSPRDVSGCPAGSFPDDSLAGDSGATRSGRRNCPRDTIPAGQLGPDGTDGRRSGQVATAFATRTQGSAYGLEVLIKRRLTQRLGGLISYTLSRSTREVGRDTFVANFDRTHVLNAALAYSLGRRWRAGARLMFYTGLPAARDPSLPDGGPSRLPSFYRIDLRLEKRWNPSPRVSLSFVAEWMNTTLRKETVSTSCTLQGCTAQEIGPVSIPSLGLEGTF